MFNKIKLIIKSLVENPLMKNLLSFYSLVCQFSKACSKKTMPYVKRHKKIVYGGVSTIFVIGIIIFGVNRNVSEDVHREDQKQTDVLSKQLDNISTKLVSLQKVVSKKNAVVDLDAVRADLNSVTHEAQQLADKSDELITHQIKESTAGLNKQLTAINTKLKKIESENKHVKYLKAKALPFEVSHIDNIQRQNVVTVSYDHTVFPMDVGDSLTDWKLINADFAKQTAEFVNHKNQHVIVNLNHINTKRS